MSDSLPSTQKVRRSPAVLLRAALLATVAYLAVVAALLICEDNLVFRPAAASLRWRENVPSPPFHDHYLLTRGGETIHARLFPSCAARGVALVCHSQNANLSICWPAASISEWHRATGQSVLLFDYPGYGRSTGKPSELGCYEAAEACWQWLTMQRGIAAEDVLIVGRSLGTAVAVDLASRHRPRALVLISPFTSIPDVAQARYPMLPAQLLMKNRFNSAARIHCCACPLLVFHGSEDWKVPVDLGKKLFEAAPQPHRFVLVKDAGHGDAAVADFFPALRQFLDELALRTAISHHN